MNGEYAYRDHTIRKEYYADGPSLFTWVVYGPDNTWIGERNRLRDAKVLVDDNLQR